MEQGVMMRCVLSGAEHHAQMTAVAAAKAQGSPTMQLEEILREVTAELEAVRSGSGPPGH